MKHLKMTCNQAYYHSVLQDLTNAEFDDTFLPKYVSVFVGGQPSLKGYVLNLSKDV